MTRAGYAADLGVLRGLLFDLAEARLSAQMTAHAQNYHTLGVEDISDPQAQGLEIRMAGLDEPVRVIIGKPGKFPNSRYVRLAGHAQSWRIDHSLEIAREPGAWLQKKLLAVPAERIQHVRIRHAEVGGELLIESRGKGSHEFVLSQPPLPKDRQVAESQVYRVASALSALQLTDVALVQALKGERIPVAVTMFGLHDGVNIEVSTFTNDGQQYITLKASVADNHGRSEQETADAREFAKDTNARVQGWAFVLPEPTQRALTLALEKLLQEEKV